MKLAPEDGIPKLSSIWVGLELFVTGPSTRELHLLKLTENLTWCENLTILPKIYRAYRKQISVNQ